MSRRGLVGCLVGVLLVGCSGITLPEDEDYMTGVIESRNVPAAVGTPNILVHHGDDPEGDSKTIYAVEGAEIGVRADDGSVRRGHLDALEIGKSVNVWTTGLRLTSAPGMMTAVAVEVLPSGTK